MAKDNGGQAFPCNLITEHYHVSDANGMASGRTKSIEHPGMSFRDYCAATALIGFANDYNAGVEWLAERAYALADAMIAERNKQQGD